MNIKNLIIPFLMLSGAATLASASTINELEVNGSASNNDTLASAQLAASSGAPNSNANGFQASLSVRSTGKGNGDGYSPFFVKGGKDYFDIDGALANFYRLLGLLKTKAKLVVPAKDSASAKAGSETTTEVSQDTSDSSVPSDASGGSNSGNLSSAGASTSSAASFALTESTYFISALQTGQNNALTVTPVRNAPTKVPLPSSVLLFGVGAVTLLLMKGGSKKATNM